MSCDGSLANRVDSTPIAFLIADPAGRQGRAFADLSVGRAHQILERLPVVSSVLGHGDTYERVDRHLRVCRANK